VVASFCLASASETKLLQFGLFHRTQRPHLCVALSCGQVGHPQQAPAVSHQPDSWTRGQAGECELLHLPRPTISFYQGILSTLQSRSMY